MTGRWIQELRLNSYSGCRSIMSRGTRACWSAVILLGSHLWTWRWHMIRSVTKYTLWAIAELAVAFALIEWCGGEGAPAAPGEPGDELPLGIITGMPYQTYHESGQGLARLLTRRWGHSDRPK